MGSKTKGTDAERELIHLFWATGKWVAARVAGSGSMHYPAPDIIASNGMRSLVIECKSTKKGQQYLARKELGELVLFAKKFNAEPWVGVRFNRQDWIFLRPEDLSIAGKTYGTTKREAAQKGVSFAGLLLPERN